MLNITVTDDAAARLREILEDESEGALVRLRETKCGVGWKSKVVLRVSIDEPEDVEEDEDVQVQADTLQFVVSKEVIDTYGENFSVYMDEHQTPSAKITIMEWVSFTILDWDVFGSSG